MPEVSVLMTVYNGMPYLQAAVESILKQTLSDFEFIIVDDGSTDGSEAFLSGITDSRVRVIRQENAGTAAAANRGLELVTTPFVARMDADDLSMPQRLEQQLGFMLVHNDVGIVGTQIVPAGEKGVGGSLSLPSSHEDIFSAMMECRHGLAHSTIMIRTSVLKQVGGYWSLPLIDDWDLMLRVGEVSKLANLDDVCLHYRVHSGSLNGSSMWRMHRHISYAVECANRRQSNSREVSFDEFEMMLARRPVWSRLAEIVHVHALTQYRLAIADILSNHRTQGYLRLGWSALCSPPRTVQRIGRFLKSRSKTLDRDPSTPELVR